MPNLFWRTGEKIRSLLATPYASEEEFEDRIFKSSHLLGEIFILKRQVRGGGKKEIPDIIAIDNDGNVCIIEMKNVPVDASIIPQVLTYAIWAETSPDSIKSLWLQRDDRPDEVEPNWDELSVKILIIAPSILRSTLDVVNKINYDVELIEVTRWIEGENEFLLVNTLEPEKRVVRPVAGRVEYGETEYKKYFNNKSVEQFLSYCHKLETLVKKQGWDLRPKYNKNYCGFKAGFFNAFGVHWQGTKSFAFFIKISETEAKKAKLPIKRYETQWKQAVYAIEPGKTKAEDYLKLFELAYKKLSGAIL